MNGVTAGIGSGLLRNLFWKNIELNIVCADFVTNGTFAIAWHTATEYKRTIFHPKIYHINRASDKALFFGKFNYYILSLFRTLFIICWTANRGWVYFTIKHRWHCFSVDNFELVLMMSSHFSFLIVHIDMV